MPARAFESVEIASSGNDSESTPQAVSFGVSVRVQKRYRLNVLASVMAANNRFNPKGRVEPVKSA
jgi:hypothetical protein